MANYSVAYDFSLFEERDGNAVRVADPRSNTGERRRVREVPEPRENVVELPKEKLRENQRAKVKPLAMIVRVTTLLVILASVLSIVYSQVQLTELTDQINMNEKVLAEQEALEVQLTMQTAEKVNTADVEEYARKQLGMSQINESQVVYMNMASSDHGTVLQETKELNFFDNIIETVKSWFA